MILKNSVNFIEKGQMPFQSEFCLQQSPKLKNKGDSITLKNFSFSLVALLAALPAAQAGGVSKEKIRQKINLVKMNADYRFRRFYGVVISNSDKPNAYCAGTHIIVTKPLLRLLNERELLAVVAHEMAHREKHHIFSRVGMMTGGAIAALFDFGSEDSYRERLSGFNADYRLRQEIQADCLAYNWLDDLKHKGFNVDPRDLNKATNKIMGIDFSQVDPEYFDDNPAYIRFLAVEKGYGANCEL